MVRTGRPRSVFIDEKKLIYGYSVLGKTQYELASEFGCTQTVIGKRLKELHIPLVHREPKRIFNILKSELEYRYLHLGQSTPDIAKGYGCSKPTILALLHAYHIPVRSGKVAHNTSSYHAKFKRLNLPKKELYTDYIIKGLSLDDLAGIYGCSYGGVRKALIRYGIPLRDKQE